MLSTIQSWFAGADWSAVSAVAAVISLGALAFSSRQAKSAKEQADISRLQAESAEEQVRFAQKALNQGRLAGLYSSFDLANQAILDNPDLLHEVHGLPRSVPPEEVKAVIYLSILLDAYQRHWTDLYDGNCLPVLEKLRDRPIFLNRILSVEANHSRWEIIKPIFYNTFDDDFICVVDAIIKEERERLRATHEERIVSSPTLPRGPHNTAAQPDS